MQHWDLYRSPVIATVQPNMEELQMRHRQKSEPIA